MCTTAFSPYIVSKMSLSPLPSINVPIAPNKFMKVWKLPNNSTASLIGLVSATSCNSWDAFQNRGWSNVTTGVKLYLDARLQIYRRLEYMHVLSPEYISIIGRKNIDDCPGWSHSLWSVCIIPLPIWHWWVEIENSSHNKPALWFISFNVGGGWNSIFWRTWFANLYYIISTCVFSVTCNWDIFFLKTVWLIFWMGVMPAIIPIPWNVPFPSRDTMLWSTLSAANKSIPLDILAVAYLTRQGTLRMLHFPQIFRLLSMRNSNPSQRDYLLKIVIESDDAFVQQAPTVMELAQPWDALLAQLPVQYLIVSDVCLFR